VVDVIRALDRRGYAEIAGRILEMQRQRVAGDYLQPSAIFDADFKVLSAINDPNDYRGPGTGYRLSPERWRELQNLPQVKAPLDLVAAQPDDRRLVLHEIGPARIGEAGEVVIGVGPAFGSVLYQTLSGLAHADVLRELVAGITDEGLRARVVRIRHTSDCAVIGHQAARLSGTGIAVGIQSKGTTVIHQRDLAPLNNLELFPQAPNLTLQSYRAIGRNAARYAAGRPTAPVPVTIDNMLRLRLIVHTTLMHLRETGAIVPDAAPVELCAVWS
jgi:hypothetical protein